MREPDSIRLWNAPKLQLQYKWSTNGQGLAIGTAAAAAAEHEYIVMAKVSRSMCWNVVSSGGRVSQAGARQLKKAEEKTGITFATHPWLTDIPCTLGGNVSPRRALVAIDRARKIQLYKDYTAGRKKIIEGMRKAAERSDWNRQMQAASITSTWKNQRGLTPYQTWVNYRATTLQLNLHHAGRTKTSRCPLDAGCGEQKETPEHIMWSCERAR